MSNNWTLSECRCRLWHLRPALSVALAGSTSAAAVRQLPVWLCPTLLLLLLPSAHIGCSTVSLFCLRCLRLPRNNVGFPSRQLTSTDFTVAAISRCVILPKSIRSAAGQVAAQQRTGAGAGEIAVAWQTGLWPPFQGSSCTQQQSTIANSLLTCFAHHVNSHAEKEASFVHLLLR